VHFLLPDFIGEGGGVEIFFKQLVKRGRDFKWCFGRFSRNPVKGAIQLWRHGKHDKFPPPPFEGGVYSEQYNIYILYDVEYNPRGSIYFWGSKVGVLFVWGFNRGGAIIIDYHPISLNIGYLEDFNPLASKALFCYIWS